MSDTAQLPPISLPASSWYLWRRVVAMSVLPLAFSIAFFYDWKIGYPAKKIQYDAEQAWKKEGRDPQEWMRHAEAQGWDTKPDEMTDEKIANQLSWGIGVGVVGLALLGYYLASYPKRLVADAESFTPPWGPRVPFASVKRLDRRPWKHKGLAHAFYDHAGKEKKATIDDLRFPGAEAVLERLQNNFDGEILDLAEEEPAATEEAPEQPAARDVPTTNAPETPNS